MFKNLFSPITINKTVIKNRIAYPSLGLLYSYDGKINDKYTEYFNINCRKRSRLTLFISIDVNFIQTEHVRYYYYKFIIKLWFKIFQIKIIVRVWKTVEKNKMLGLIFFIISVVVIIINLVAIYPFIKCTFAPLVFWLIALLGIVGALIFYFDVKIFHSEEIKA